MLLVLLRHLDVFGQFCLEQIDEIHLLVSVIVSDMQADFDWFNPLN